jgi:nicotinic acid mononucleotide adenylyltransferase
VALCSRGLYAEQAEAAREAFPQAEIVFGMGSDKLFQLMDPAWYEDRQTALDELFSVARVAYAVRESDEERVGEVLEQTSRWAARMEPLALPPVLGGLSSRRVREQIARGADVTDLVPAEVIPFVERRLGERGGEP